MTNATEDFILAHLDDGVRAAGIVNGAGDMIPRNAVSYQIWQKIAAQLAR